MAVARSHHFQITRIPIILVLATALNIIVFILIQKLVSNELEFNQVNESINLVDFIRMQEQARPLEEKKPLEEMEPPEAEDEPPPPESPEPLVDKPQQNQLDLSMPSLNVPLSISGTPYLGDFAKANKNSFGTSRPKIAINIKPTLRVPPVYPPRALRSGIEGVVTVEFTIATNGSVKDAEIVKAKPAGIFNKAVLNAISKWKFDPDIINGKPVEKRARQDIRFSLQR